MSFLNRSSLMPSTTETRIYVGDTGTAMVDGWAGFRLGQLYQLHVERREQGVVIITPNGQAIHSPGPLILSEAQFDKGFTPSA